jgi:hypothetical protein
MAVKRSPDKKRRNLDEWDAEIEAEFQRVARQTKPIKGKRHGKQLIGCPIAFMADVCRKTEGRTALVVALCVYRRTRVCNAQTITLPASELAELGVNRPRKCEALVKLQRAGVIEVENATGRTAKVTLVWESG